MIDLNQEQHDHLTGLLRVGQPVSAIKYIKQTFGVSLKEARGFVEEFIEKHYRPIYKKPSPSFYTMRTLLGFGQGQQDLNRVVLCLPDGEDFVFCEMGEPRTLEQEKRWRELAARLTKLWGEMYED